MSGTLPARSLPRWSQIARPVARWAALGLVLVIAVLSGSILLLHQSIAPLSGVMTVAGVHRPVEVMMGQDAVPHIFAERRDDAYLALGLLHAQNRLWQMELLRRAGQGRLSEVFGIATLDHDKFIRTLGLHEFARRAVERLSPGARAALDAYAKGVNAWILRDVRRLEVRLPLEFLLLWHEPEPWQPADSIVILKMMSLQLGRNLDKEIDRLTFAALGLSPAEIEDLLPTVSQWGAPPLPDIRSLYPLRKPATFAPRPRAGLETSIAQGASNNWVVAGALTKSGKPLLAGDPHLRLSAPSTWYLVHLAIGHEEGKFANLVGASLPGTPLLPLGRGDTFAWALTNTETDVQDLYVEKLNPADPRQYLTPDGWRDLGHETTIIRVRGTVDVTLDRLSTRHGPIISSVYRGLDSMLAPGHVVALQWVGLTDDDATVEAALFDADIRTAHDALERVRPTVGPMQSMVVADTAGAIGLIAAGRMPIRGADNAVSGRAPVPGWDAIYDWKGFVPFDSLPRVENPTSNAIGTTNTRMVDANFPHLLTWDWGPTFRQQRYDELVPMRGRHDLASMRAAQLDVVSPAARRLAPLMVSATRTAQLSRRAVVELDALAGWDGGMRANIREPLIFTAWLRHAFDLVWRDDLAHAASLSLDERTVTMIDLLEGRPMARDWCDDRTTLAVEACGQILARALDQALLDLDQRFGPNSRTWQWGSAHYADGAHEPLGRLPIIGNFFNIRVPSDGGLFTLNRGKSYLGSSEPYASRDATTFRAVYDLSDLDASLFIQSTGQSGNPLSSHYRSFAERWSKGAYITIPTGRAAILGQLTGKWHLLPPRA